MNSELKRVDANRKATEAKIKEAEEKVKLNKSLPYLVSNVVEVCSIGFALAVC